MTTDRRVYVENVSRQVLQMHRLYAQLSRTPEKSPESYRQRVQVGERLMGLLASVTPEEQVEFEIW